MSTSISRLTDAWELTRETLTAHIRQEGRGRWIVDFFEGSTHLESTVSESLDSALHEACDYFADEGVKR